MQVFGVISKIGKNQRFQLYVTATFFPFHQNKKKESCREKSYFEDP